MIIVTVPLNPRYQPPFAIHEHGFTRFPNTLNGKAPRNTRGNVAAEYPALLPNHMGAGCLWNKVARCIAIGLPSLASIRLAAMRVGPSIVSVVRGAPDKNSPLKKRGSIHGSNKPLWRGFSLVSFVSCPVVSDIIASLKSLEP